MTYIPVGGLSIAKPLYDLINDKAAPQTGVNATDFWAALERILGELTPRNRALLDKRQELQEVLADWLMRGQSLQPFFVVVRQSGFVVVDKDRSRYVHGVDERQPFADAALKQARFNIGSDVDEGPPGGHLEPEFLAIAFHVFLHFCPKCPV